MKTHGLIGVILFSWLMAGCDRASTLQEADPTNNPPRADAIETTNAVLVPEGAVALTNRPAETNGLPEPR
jgi:hypothetical protein